MPTNPTIEPHGIGADMQGVVMYYYNPSTNQYELCRTPMGANTAQISATGPTVVWQPATGKKFRLLSYAIDITGNATISLGGITTLSFLDGGTAMNIAHDIWLPSLALTSVLGLVTIPPQQLPANGLLSSTVNNALNCTLTTALSGGKIRIRCYGTEE